MDYVLANIGPNKVTVNIRDSPYYERSRKNDIVGVKPKPLINLLDMYKKIGKCGDELFVEDKDKVVAPRSSLKTNDQLLFNLMKLADPLLSLYSSSKEVDNKVAKFKEELINNLTNFHGMFKKLLLHKKYKLEEVSEAIVDSSLNFDKRRPLLLYIARLLDISIMIEFTDGELPYLIKCGQKCKILKFNNQQHDMVLDLDDYVLSEKESQLHCAKMTKYLREGLKDKLPKYAVKDLRAVCEDLDISTYTDDEGQKKLCLKPELFTRILKKIESHNT